MLGEPWTKDPTIEAARTWLALHFSPSENPQAARGWEGYKPSSAFYYYLYALERSGILYGSETFGTRSWYAEGAKVLLERQRSDGSWDLADPKDDSGRVANTCFAILFLRRATEPLTAVASEDRYFKK
jgi:hypothetical protein